MSSDQLGPDKNRYCLIPRVLVFPVDEKGRILLLKGAKNKKLWANLWNGPGGHVEPGEAVPDAARRELLEETGLRAGSLTLCAQVLANTGKNPGVMFFVFKAKCLEGEIHASPEGELAWHTLNQALKLDLVEDLYTLLPLVMRHRPNEKSFWGYYDYDPNGQLIMRFSH